MSQGYTNIPDWMLDFDLDVYETIILAVIYGFSQDNESTFRGSQKFLAKKAKCSVRKVANSLKNLTELGLIKKRDLDIRGIHLCEYSANVGSECGAGDMHEVHGGYARGAYNNIEENNNNTLSIKAGAFVKPSIEEIGTYAAENGYTINAEDFFNHYESNGWKVGKVAMKDWRAAVRNWVRRQKEFEAKPQTSRQPYHKESPFEHNLRVADKMFGTDLHNQIYGHK